MTEWCEWKLNDEKIRNRMKYIFIKSILHFLKGDSKTKQETTTTNLIRFGLFLFLFICY